MKKIFLILGLLSVIACQDETTDKTPQAPNVYQEYFLMVIMSLKCTYKNTKITRFKT